MFSQRSFTNPTVMHQHVASFFLVFLVDSSLTVSVRCTRFHSLCANGLLYLSTTDDAADGISVTVQPTDYDADGIAVEFGTECNVHFPSLIDVRLKCI